MTWQWATVDSRRVSHAALANAALVLSSKDCQGQKDTTKKLCDKHFAELSGELSGAICLKTLLKKREGVPEVGTKPLKALRGFRASNRGSNRGSRKTPEALRGKGPCSGAPSPSINGPCFTG